MNDFNPFMDEQKFDSDKEKEASPEDEESVKTSELSEEDSSSFFQDDEVKEEENRSVQSLRKPANNANVSFQSAFSFGGSRAAAASSFNNGKSMFAAAPSMMSVKDSFKSFKVRS